MRLVVFLIVSMIAVAAIAASDRRQPFRAQFTIPNVVAPPPRPPMRLKAPCAIGPQNFDPYDGRNA